MMKFRYSVLVIVIIFLGIVIMGWLTSLPDNSQRSISKVIDDGEATSLGQVFQKELSDQPGLSGVFLLRSGLDAFVGRAVLARKAEKSIDVQYYMFHQDTVGRLLINELLDAADRGVRVRLLVDDMYGEEADDVWLALDSHPTFEVRLFNPFVRGHSKNLQFITRVKEVNHRMHSKSFTVDNQATIVGGRNIGDEYFSADPELAFTDRDVMAIGPVVPDVSEAFDQYWNSEHTFPMQTLLPDTEIMPLNQLRKDLDDFYHQKQTSIYIDALNNSMFANALRNNTAEFSFAKAIVVHDSPDKMDRGEAWKDGLLMSQLAPYILEAKEEYILVSPYFVPGERAAEALCDMINRGIKVSVLTNSLASNDVAAVHTGYIRHRKQLLRCGVTLYELNEQLKEEEKKLFSWLPGLSKSSLHAKTMSIDHQTMFVGSFNFDQRSLFLNTEIGILFYEPKLAKEVAEHFDKNIEKVAFRVELMTDNNGKEYLRWSGQEDGKLVILFDEPYATSMQKAAVQLMRLLPIDSML
jgi:putative cardiolipin synthase